MWSPGTSPFGEWNHVTCFSSCPKVSLSRHEKHIIHSTHLSGNKQTQTTQTRQWSDGGENRLGLGGQKSGWEGQSGIPLTPLSPLSYAASPQPSSMPMSHEALETMHYNCRYKLLPPHDCGLKQELYIFITMPLSLSMYGAQTEFKE